MQRVIECRPHDNKTVVQKEVDKRTRTQPFRLSVKTSRRKVGLYLIYAHSITSAQDVYAVDLPSQF